MGTRAHTFIRSLLVQLLRKVGLVVGFSVWENYKRSLKHTEAFILDLAFRTTATRDKATICNNLHLNLCLLLCEVTTCV